MEPGGTLENLMEVNEIWYSKIRQNMIEPVQTRQNIIEPDTVEHGRTQQN